MGEKPIPDLVRDLAAERPKPQPERPLVDALVAYVDDPGPDTYEHLADQLRSYVDRRVRAYLRDVEVIG